MKSFVLRGKNRSVEVTVPVEDYIKVYSYNSLLETHLSYFLAQCDYEKLVSFTSTSALLRFAKENHVFRDYPKTSCPCPPETSPLAEVGGDSFYKLPCSDCGGHSLHHHNYGFIFCDGCAALAAANTAPTADDIPPCFLGGAK